MPRLRARHRRVRAADPISVSVTNRFGCVYPRSVFGRLLACRWAEIGFDLFKAGVPVRFPKPLRLIIPLLLLVSSGMLGNSPASAANATFSVDCSTSNRLRPNIANGETVTITVAGNACSSITFSPIPTPGHLFGTLTVDGTPVAPGGGSLVSQGSTVVYTAPGSGSDYDYIYFSGSGPLGEEFAISFPVVSGAFVDNGDGTVTVTFVGAVRMGAFPQGSSCPSASQANNYYTVLNTLRANESPIGATSPYTQAADPARVPAGVYEGCLYYPYVTDAVIQSGPIYIGISAPTTTVPSADPVTPAFAG